MNQPPPQNPNVTQWQVSGITITAERFYSGLSVMADSTALVFIRNEWTDNESLRAFHRLLERVDYWGYVDHIAGKMIEKRHERYIPRHKWAGVENDDHIPSVETLFLLGVAYRMAQEQSEATNGRA